MNGKETSQIRMIAVDLDGTLLSHEGQVGERNRQAIRLAAASGAELVIATGRRHSYSMKVLRAAGLADDAIVISSNGAVVRQVDATLIERTYLEPEAVQLLLGGLGELRNALWSRSISLEMTV